MVPATPPARRTKSASPGSEIRAHLLDVLTPVVADAGFDLENVSVSTVGRRKLVRVVVDRDGGVDLDGVATVSRVVSDLLDNDVQGDREFADPYVLEVTSPGVDRPLTEPRHWRRAAGRLVRFTVDDEQITARVADADEQRLIIDADGQQRELSWSRVGAGRIQVEFDRRSDGDVGEGS